MPEQVRIAVFTVVALAFALQLVLLGWQLAKIRKAPRQSRAGWPMRFPVHMFVYMAGMKVAKWATGFWLTVNGFTTVTVLAGWWILGESIAFSMLMTLLFGWTGLLQLWMPRTCAVSDDGIEFVELYPWDCVQRYEIKADRLHLVVKRPRNRTMMQHLDIPLNGLSRELLPVLEQHLAELTNKAPQHETEPAVTFA